MTDVLFSLIFDEALDVYERLGMPFQQGNRIMRFSPFNAYPTEDGWVVIGIGHDAMWRALCTPIEREDLAHDPDWGRMDWRVEHNAQVDEMLSRVDQRPADRTRRGRSSRARGSLQARSRTSMTCSLGRIYRHVE